MRLLTKLHMKWGGGQEEHTSCEVDLNQEMLYHSHVILLLGFFFW